MSRLARRRAFRVLVATDGSPQSRGAAAAATVFPWPAGVRPAFASATILGRPPVDGILARARQLGAGAIVTGSRGLGALGRLLRGSVSRDLARRAPCPVLVVKGRPRQMRRLVLGLDGSANSRRAAALVLRLRPPHGGRVTVVRVVEPIRLPSLAQLPPVVRARLRSEAMALRRQALGAARRQVEEARERLERAGWPARSLVLTGVPLPELLRAAGAARAQLLVVGARGAGGLARRLLGSVADGAVARSPVSVLVVK